MNTMIFKREFIHRFAQEYGYTLKEAKEIYENMFECINDILFIDGEDLCIKDFGTFRHKTFKEKRCIHPATGEEVIIPERDVVTFSSIYKSE
jgi:nucleoid DNA-binding protein